MKTAIYIFTAIIFISVLWARASYTGYTRKSGNQGCSCHGNANANVVVEITGPVQIKTGATEKYQVTIGGESGSQVCVDIAASTGTLSPYDSALKLSKSELITNGTKSYSNGKYTYSFNFTAPNTVGNQKIYATGLSSKNSGWNFAPDKAIKVVSATGIDEQNSIPGEFVLSQNFPNPFNPSTAINFFLPIKQNVVGQIINVAGEVVAELVNGNLEPGNHQVIWNAQSAATGIYFFKLQTDQAVKTIKLLYLK